MVQSFLNHNVRVEERYNQRTFPVQLTVMKYRNDLYERSCFVLLYPRIISSIVDMGLPGYIPPEQKSEFTETAMANPEVAIEDIKSRIMKTGKRSQTIIHL